MKISRISIVIILIVLSYLSVQKSQLHDVNSDMRILWNIMVYVFAFAAADLTFAYLYKHIELTD
jgi:hypothetical protein